ncbi:MAG TPA: hypothetical protein VHX39_04440, partial [Acetobacteraceae bacterium]|nr:hypothetical protein [Acetobacteraceae bacterium]
MFVRIGVLWALVLAMALSATAQVNVTQFHNHYTRDGLYVDSHFTTAAAAGLTRDLNFNGTISGSVRAQPLYISGGPGGVPMIIAVTESDNVYALNATNGNVIWHDSVGTGVTSGLQCSDSINPLGITGTPAVDLASRSLFFNAMSSAGGTIKHLIFSLNVDTGATNSGWPVDVGATAAFGGNSFLAVAQTQLSACTVLNGYVCVAYCGCGDAPATYRGWIVGVQISNPANVQAWDVGSRGGGSWGVGGVASDDGTNAFIATGNTYNPGSWTGGEAIIRFQPGPVFSGLTNDYWVPTNWQALDTADLDLASSGPLMLDVPGATPSQLVVALGKDGNGYLINRTNMGGITAPVAQKTLSLANIDQAAATYRTAQGTYFVCNVSTTSSSISSQTQLLGVRVSAANPPAMSTIWTNSQGGRAS